MIEFLLATAMIVGQADIGPDQVRYEVLHNDGTIETIIEDNSEVK